MACSSLTGLESDPRPSLRYRDPGWMMMVLAVRISDRGSPDIMSSANIHLDTLKTNGLNVGFSTQDVLETLNRQATLHPL